MSAGAALAAVVVPVYNAAAFLPACLASISAQTMPDFRCYLIDDGSSDGSGELCERIAAGDDRFFVLHQAQCGVSAARTAGVRAAKADGVDWVAFCDADDLYHPEFLRTLIGAARSSGLPAACCRYDSFTDAVPEDGPVPEEAQRLLAPAHLDALLHDHKVDYSLCNKVYAASILDLADFDNGFAFNEDLLANWQVFNKIDGCAFVDFAGYHYRQHAASASHRPLAPASIDEQRRGARDKRPHPPPAQPASAGGV